MANDEFCEVCEREFQKGKRKAEDRKAPLFGWDRDGAPNHKKKLCWKHWGPDTEEQMDYKQYIVANKKRLKGAHLEEVNLQEVNLPDANLERAQLSGCILRDAKLSWGNLESANLSFAKLKDADLLWANLQGAKLDWADLSNAEISEAFLQDASMRWANLEGAAFIGANLSRANLSEVRIRHYMIRTMIGDGFRSLSGKPRTMITRWDRVVGLGSVFTDDLTNRYIRDSAYAESLREARPIWAFLWRWTCFYGQSFLLWAFWCLILALIFGLAYSQWDLLNFEGSARTSFTTFYFSIVTFTTLGFGDVRPSCLAGEILVTAEVILGYIGLGGLISILANKVARRA